MKQIGKFACRQNTEPLTPPNSDCGLFLIRKLKYIVRTTIKIIGYRRLLVLCLYARGNTPDGKPVLAFTVFQASNTFITYDHRRDTRTPWRSSMLNNLNSSYNFLLDECAFYSKKDEDNVNRFCNPYVEEKWQDQGFQTLDIMQRMIRTRETHRRQVDRERRIRARMRPLRPLPGDIEDWLRWEVVPAYFFYDRKQGKKPVKGICTACGQQIELTGAGHNAEGICPNCGRTIKMKSNGKRGHIWDRETASVVQKLNEHELIVRIIKAHSTWDKNCPGKLEWYEETRVFVCIGKDGAAKTEPYFNSRDSVGITTWKKGYPPVMYLYGRNFNAETCGFLYCRNLKRELAGTAWQYCQLREFYCSSPWEKMEVAPYLQAYPSIPAIEFFVKLKLNWLVAHLVYKKEIHEADRVINPQGKNLREVLQIEPSDLTILQRPEACVETLRLLRMCRTKGYTPEAEFLKWAAKHEVADTELVEKALQYAGQKKLMRYMEEQFHARDASSSWDFRNTLTDYRDYLGFCEKLNYDLTDEFILFPRNLKQAHDQAQGMVRLDEVKQYDKQIAAHEGKLKRLYQFEADGLIVLPPHTAGEIVTEGQKLHHCVGGYVESVAEQRCSILFIRQEGKEQAPFYTVEVRGDKIYQVRGRNNCSPTPEVKAFLEKWTKKKHLAA